LPWSAAHVAYSLIRPKFHISNIRHDGALSIGNFMLMMKKPKNLEFEPVHPKNVLLASVVHGIFLFIFTFFDLGTFNQSELFLCVILCIFLGNSDWKNIKNKRKFQKISKFFVICGSRVQKAGKFL
jgi:membrane protein CcdC involved in cytochrome C biogenesis